ncbi:protein inturned [Harmonia axyridis]|uniref:protein inturned n=1 Tax=Harmonia axyridis TaxID=115357 RepID=UPI001E278DAB|nr:protein inturned [Harmonia axyridis]
MSESKQFENHPVNDELSSEEEWSESSSYYSDSDSSIPDWDSSVDERTGEVLYIECHPFVTQNIKEDSSTQTNTFVRNKSRRSTRGKFLKLLRRRESKRYSKRNAKVQEPESHTSNKVKFQDFQEGEEREVLLTVRNEPSHKNNISTEALFGINVSTLSDGLRLMVAGFSNDSSAKYDKNIKIGDWLKSVNGIEVDCHNIVPVLQQISGYKEVLMKLQRVAGVEITKDPPINVLNNQSHFVRQLVSFSQDDNDRIQEQMCGFPVGFLYLDTDNMDESASEYQNVIYCYPRPLQKNILCSSKGIFITLNHLLKDITKNHTKITSFTYNKTLCHTSYFQSDKRLLLLTLPDNCAKMSEIELMTSEIVRMLIFTYNTLEDCFQSENLHHVDHILSMFFVRMLNCGVWPGELKVPDSYQSIPPSDYVFEDLLPAVHSVDLPNEAIVQVEDALTELEACDYREWNEEPLDCQRIFTVLGSAWYHAGYLITSHFIHEDLVDIHSFCKHQGILHLSKTEPVKTLILWREVFPSSCRNLTDPIFNIPEARRYLLVVGTKNDLLAVIMEAGGCTEAPEENAAPEPFYVEEVQATLSHIQELGIPELADRFLNMNPGTQVTLPMAPTTNKKILDVLNFVKPQPGHFRDSYLTTRKQEVTSILKKRGNDQSQIYTSSYSLTEDTYDVCSEDSGSQGCGSEFSDDPVVGQKAQRRNRYDSNSEESDSEETADGSQMSSNSFDVAELKQMLLTETEGIQPIQITAGPSNVLYHFVQFDKLEGILLSPPECRIESTTRKTVLSNFRKCCQHLHSLFQNTIRFKNMGNQEMTKTAINKSLIAIKEQGTMFECPSLDERDPKKNRICYWVVGRLFFTPHIREMYVCYNDSIPQNMIELAFKLNLGFGE